MIDILSNYKNKIKYKFVWQGKIYEGSGSTSQDAYWLPNGLQGFKIFPYDDTTFKNLKTFQKWNLDIFPDIYAIDKQDDTIVLTCENVREKLPTFEDLHHCVHQFYKWKLEPEDGWFKFLRTKTPNIIGKKIVDFQRFKINPHRYCFPFKKTPEELDRIYKEALKKYKARGDNKWKGNIYQGMNFSDYKMSGYSSDGQIWDSYHKLSFCYTNACKGADVLDLGSNQGFFSFQSALAGAKSVVGIDMCPEDVWLANQLNEFDNVKFIQGDITKDIPVGNYKVIYLLSVLHQIYPDMKNCEAFLKQLASMCTDVLIFETPINHQTMTIKPKLIEYKLNEFFGDVRLAYEYNAYSAGERQIYICRK